MSIISKNILLTSLQAWEIIFMSAILHPDNIYRVNMKMSKNSFHKFNFGVHISTLYFKFLLSPFFK